MSAASIRLMRVQLRCDAAIYSELLVVAQHEVLCRGTSSSSDYFGSEILLPDTLPLFIAAFLVTPAVFNLAALSNFFALVGSVI